MNNHWPVRRRWIWGGIAVLVGLLAARAETTLDIYWIDVEGGAATLTVTPSGESILVDTGMPGDRDPRRIHEVATRVAGLKQIDHLVVTHFDIDHYGGAADLAKLMPIARLYDYGLPDPAADLKPDTQRLLRDTQAYRNLSVSQRLRWRPGDVLKLQAPTDPALPRVRVVCLSALQQTIPPREARPTPNPLCDNAADPPEDKSYNADSISLLLEYGSFRFFNGADLTRRMEKRLVCPVNLVGRVDVYQVDHHGFDISNYPVLVRSLAPRVTIMLNGTQKGCGPETVALLKAIPSIQANYQMHRNLRPDNVNTDREFIANWEAQCAANYIKLSVARDGRSYTVSIPGTGHQRAFQTRTGP